MLTLLSAAFDFGDQRDHVAFGEGGGRGSAQAVHGNGVTGGGEVILFEDFTDGGASGGVNVAGGMTEAEDFDVHGNFLGKRRVAT